MTANEHRGEVEIELDKPRILRFKNSSLVKLKKHLGTGYLEFILRLRGNETSHEEKEAAEREGRDPDPLKLIEGGEMIQLDETAALLWAALLHESPKLTYDEALDLMEYAPGDGQQEKEAYVLEKVMAAFLSRLAGPKNAKDVVVTIEKEAAGTPPQQETSKSSGSSDDVLQLATGSDPKSSGS